MFTAKSAAYIAAALGVGTFVGGYALYGLYADSKKKVPPGTTFNDAAVIKNIRDAAVTRVRDKGIPVFPSYKTKAQVLAEETERKRLIEETRLREQQILEKRRELEAKVREAFAGSHKVARSAEAIMEELETMREELSALGGSCSKMALYTLVDEAYRAKFGSY